MPVALQGQPGHAHLEAPGLLERRTSSRGDRADESSRASRRDRGSRNHRRLPAPAQVRAQAALTASAGQAFPSGSGLAPAVAHRCPAGSAAARQAMREVARQARREGHPATVSGRSALARPARPGQRRAAVAASAGSRQVVRQRQQTSRPSQRRHVVHNPVAVRYLANLKGHLIARRHWRSTVLAADRCHFQETHQRRQTDLEIV